MKRLIMLLGLWAALVGAAQADHDDVRVSFGFFYSSLSPHGEWIEIERGQHVWRPFHVSRSWRPYTYGRWAWTQHGWYWVSHEPFGWIVFHYGRWYYDDFYGWVWVPDYEWGPAWVEWRYNDDYIGWAPLPPYATFSVNVGIRFTRVWVAPMHYWVFVPCRGFTGKRIERHVISTDRTTRFFGSTRTSTRYDYDGGRIVNRGVETDFVERMTGSRIEQFDVVESGNRSERVIREGGRERIEVHRPRREDIRQTPEIRRDPSPSIERQTRRGGTSGRDREIQRPVDQQRREIRPRRTEDRNPKPDYRIKREERKWDDRPSKQDSRSRKDDRGNRR
jgi:hypothetical protein